MRIGYVVGAYPSRSETFIEREIAALEARGVAVELFPLWRLRGQAAPTRPVHWCRGLHVRAQCAHLVANVRWQWRFLMRLLSEGRPAVQALARLSAAFAMGDRMRRLGVERVHAHFGNAPSTAGWVAATVARVPFSFAVHARDVFAEGHFLAEKARAADRIVACNSAVAERTAERVDAADRAKIVLVPHGLPLERCLFRAELPGGEALVLGVGRLVEKKGFGHLVRAMAQLRRKGARARCWLIGDGPERKALRRAIAELGLADAVELKGWLPQEEVRAALWDASVLAVPSVVARDGDMDGLPNVALEAAATGVPIVATRVGGIGDLVRDGDTGLTAKAGDAAGLATKIAEVLAHPDRAMARARRARELAEERFEQGKTTDLLLGALGI